jgi:type III restriction enzyme
MDDRTISINLRLKDKFKQSSIYKNGLIYLNKRIETSRKNVTQLPERLRNLNFE